MKKCLFIGVFMLMFFGYSKCGAEAAYFERCVPVDAASSEDRESAYELIRRTAVQFRVPQGLLYGIWRKESQGLLCGWKRSDDPNWFRTSELSRSGGECLRKYAHKGKNWCKSKFLALQAVCSQRYRRGPWRGERVCDPRHAFTSYAHAMGPMQIMPTEIVRWKDGRWQYSRYAVDANQDGAVDPHDLADALAVTAGKLLATAGEERNWKQAANRYYGSSLEGYWEGKCEWSKRRNKLRYRKGVRDYWQTWCAEILPCSRGFALMSRRP